MLTLQQIKNQKNELIEKLKIKNIDASITIEEIVQLDSERKINQLKIDGLLANINRISQEIGILFSKQKFSKTHDPSVTSLTNDFNVLENLKQEVSLLKTQVKPLKDLQLEIEDLIQQKLVSLPNIPHSSVPIGISPESNELIKTGGTIPTLHANFLCHWDLIKKYELIDFELGAKITGSGFPLYIGKGAKLQRALVQYFLDFNIQAKYKEYLPPFMVNEDSAFATGQLPDKEGQMYFMPADKYYLIPTSEVPVTNIYRDTILKESELPIKMTAYSPCFRREAGSFGKDVRGLNRVHQFEKVEIIQIVHPEKSYETLEEMVQHVENLLINLGLHYRILRLCGGDMSFASALTYDFEVYSAAQNKWLEVSSVTNFESFQTNRLKCRFKDQNDKMQFAHSLNGSSLALPRIVAALLENYQEENCIKLPEVLHKYTGFTQID